MFYEEFQSFKNPGDNLGQFFHLFPTWTVEMLTKCSDCLKSKLRNIHKIKHKGSQNFKEPLLLFKVKIVSAIPQKKSKNGCTMLLVTAKIVQRVQEILISP